MSLNPGERKQNHPLQEKDLFNLINAREKLNHLFQAENHEPSLAWSAVKDEAQLEIDWVAVAKAWYRLQGIYKMVSSRRNREGAEGPSEVNWPFFEQMDKCAKTMPDFFADEPLENEGNIPPAAAGANIEPSIERGEMMEGPVFEVKQVVRLAAADGQAVYEEPIATPLVVEDEEYSRAPDPLPMFEEYIEQLQDKENNDQMSAMLPEKLKYISKVDNLLHDFDWQNPLTELKKRQLIKDKDEGDAAIEGDNDTIPEKKRRDSFDEDPDEFIREYDLGKCLGTIGGDRMIVEKTEDAVTITFISKRRVPVSSVEQMDSFKRPATTTHRNNR